jgi:rubredoxin
MLDIQKTLLSFGMHAPQQNQRNNSMACPKCKCKVHYKYDSGDDMYITGVSYLERCAHCGFIFDEEDALDDDDDYPQPTEESE